MADSSISIAARSDSATKTRVSVRDFEFIVDQPENFGGENDGPTPVEYFLGAWAACMSGTCKLVAAEHEIDIQALSFDVASDIDTAKLMGQESTNRCGLQGIEAEIEIDCDADEKAIKAMIDETVTRCPVTDNVTNETPLNWSVSLPAHSTPD